MKVRSLKRLERFGQIEQVAPGCQSEHTQSARYGQSFAPRDKNAFSIIHQEQIGAEFDGKRDRVFFTSVKVRHCCIRNPRVAARRTSTHAGGAAIQR
jgi:hypothetical protein